jgi:hypothetical protein
MGARVRLALGDVDGLLPGYSRREYWARHDSITTSWPAAASRCASSVVCRAPARILGRATAW